MNKKMYYIPEAIGTIFWLIMDFCWLSKDYFTAILCMFIAVTCLGIATANVFLDKNCKASERLNFVTSWTWCLMNSFWFISDIPFKVPDPETNELCLKLSKILFVISSVLILTSIVFSLIEKQVFNFKRLKISFSEEKVDEKTDGKIDGNYKLNESLNKSNLKIKNDVHND